MSLGEYAENVILRDGTEVSIRPMERHDGPALLAFFRAVPEEDRLFLREDVTQAEVVDRFVRNLDYDTVLPLLAFREGKVVGDATLHRSHRGWSTHVAHIRGVVARSVQRRGLGTHLAHLLVKRAIAAGLDKLVVEVVDNQIGAKKACERLGFREEAILRRHVTDIHGKRRDLVVMTNDVSHIWERMEALVADFSPMHE